LEQQVANKPGSATLTRYARVEHHVVCLRDADLGLGMLQQPLLAMQQQVQQQQQAGQKGLCC
jgi:hypothetical protein